VQHLISALTAIPDVIWSGIIASLLTLSGVLLSNRSNTYRLLLQLKHDAAEKSRERTSALRRETYLRAAEELAKLNAFLSGLPQVDFAKVNLGEGMQGFFTAAARLQLVAEPKTALLSNKLSARYAELVLALLGDLMPIGSARSDINIADSLLAKAQAEAARLVAEMARINESGSPNDEALLALRRSFDFHQSQAAKYASDRNEAWKQLNGATVVFQKRLLREMKEIGLQQLELLVEIRRDLGLQGDLSELEAFMREEWVRMEQRLEALVSQLEAA
jgi:hypothetical protein